MGNSTPMTFTEIGKQIEKAERESGKRKKIPLPKWIKIVRYIRVTQCPVQYRAVFDIEAHPEYSKREPADRVKLANDLANFHLKTEGVEYFDMQTYLDGVAYIKQHPILHEAMVTLYRNLKLHHSQIEDIDDAHRKARNSPDPVKMMSLWRTVQQMNRAFEEEHARKVEQKKKQPTLVVNVPEYMQGQMPKPEQSAAKRAKEIEEDE